MTNRRDFIRGGAAFGGVFAAASLPAAEPPSVDLRDRGWYERLQLAYRTVKIGLPKPFSVLHISDTHLTAAYPHETLWTDFSRSRTQIFGGLQEHSLAESLKWAKQTVDCVIHTGDLIDFVSEANLDLVKKYLGPSADLACTAGNHEFHRLPKEKGVKPTEAYNDEGRETLERAFERDLRFAATVVNGVNFVTVENVYGYYTEHQVRCFKAEAAKGLPIVLCQHVPILTDGIRIAAERFRTMGAKIGAEPLPKPAGDARRQLEDPVTRDFLAYLRTEKLLKCVLSGHFHHFAEDRFSPTAMQYVVGGNYLLHGQELIFT